ncbi:hypothetical protein [Methanogenium cariaci]|uniref:hypothetical protein n=1 Tax=Methanogenium cariaci TaxID=2197 RepID=UPI0007864C19|nr:hypothetical protein [Methanogenium cariaci]
MYYYTSLALDSSGYPPHISYFDNTNHDLKYAFLNGTGWTTTVVDSDGDVGGIVSSLALDLKGFPHISYCDYTNTALKYAFRNGTGWTTTTVDSDGNVGAIYLARP